MQQRAQGLLGVLAAVALTGCGGSAVLVTHTARGGIIGLDGDRDQALADARRLMSEACGGAYTIVAERDAVAGTYHGRALSEHQVRYVCGPRSGLPAAPPILDDR
jgi:hypothetical protein